VNDPLLKHRFKGRVAIVTGSSRGIGFAIAERFIREGGSVVLNARDEGALKESEKRLLDLDAGGVVTIRGSVAEKETCRAVSEVASDRFGRIDYVVNNVGTSPHYGPLLHAKKFSETMALNAWSPIAVVQEAMRFGLDHSGAAVVNVTSIVSRQVHPFVAPYAASKAALEVLTKILARELGIRGIRVNAVAPGVIRTALTEPIRIGDKEEGERRIVPLQRLGEPDDVAGAVCFLLSDDASWITGITLDVDGGRLLVGDEPYDRIGIFDEPR
jgi:3-oxoacyl-[acyl-carrier protein] reductase